MINKAVRLMLVLTRKNGESLGIGENITIK